MPMSQNDLQTALKLKERVSLSPLIDFRIFGSRARGDADEYSDMDVFMEFETVDRDLRARVKNAAWEMTLESGIVVTTLLFSRNESEDSPPAFFSNNPCDYGRRFFRMTDRETIFSYRMRQTGETLWEFVTTIKALTE